MPRCSILDSSLAETTSRRFQVLSALRRQHSAPRVLDAAAET
jgi:hypothetical protein